MKNEKAEALYFCNEIRCFFLFLSFANWTSIIKAHTLVQIWITWVFSWRVGYAEKQSSVCVLLSSWKAEEILL